MTGFLHIFDESGDHPHQSDSRRRRIEDGGICGENVPEEVGDKLFRHRTTLTNHRNQGNRRIP